MFCWICVGLDKYATIRTIKGIDTKTNKEVELVIGGTGNWNAYTRNAEAIVAK